MANKPDDYVVISFADSETVASTINPSDFVEGYGKVYVFIEEDKPINRGVLYISESLNKVIRQVEAYRNLDNDEFYFDNDILNDKVHLFFKSNRNSVDEYTIRGHQFLNSFELSINTLGIEHDTMLKKVGNIIFARIKQLEKDMAMVREYERTNDEKILQKLTKEEA